MPCRHTQLAGSPPTGAQDTQGTQGTQGIYPERAAAVRHAFCTLSQLPAACPTYPPTYLHPLLTCRPQIIIQDSTISNDAYATIPSACPFAPNSTYDTKQTCNFAYRVPCCKTPSAS